MDKSLQKMIRSLGFFSVKRNSHVFLTFGNRITSGFTSSTTFGTRRFLGSASPGPLMFHNKTRILRGGGGGSKK